MINNFVDEISQLPNPLQTVISNYLQQFTEACQQQNIALTTFENIKSQLVTAFACSDYVANQLCHNPTLLQEICVDNDWLKPLAVCDYQKKLQSHEPKNQEELDALLRHFRHREIIRIAWRDVNSLASFDEQLSELSSLAETLIDYCCEKTQQFLTPRFGTPMSMDNQPQQLVVLALGKLGGDELNFSSDVDLIFCYQANGKTRGGERNLDNEEFFTRLCKLVIQSLHQVKENGFVYRVDTRLRPFGNSGPMVMSFAALETYYQNHGREWERYALIKARVISGKQHQNILLKSLRDFTYRRYLDYGVIDSLREIKKSIDSETKQKEQQSDLKKGPGGIREVEFITQAFQIINGGIKPELQQTALIPTLKLLARDQILPHNIVEELLAGYCFLRQLENRIQLFADQQTHTLPADAILDRVCVSYQCSRGELIKQLNHHRKLIEYHFQQMVAEPKKKKQTVIAACGFDFDNFWINKVDPEQGYQQLHQMGFQEPEKTFSQLMHYRDSKKYRELSTVAQTRLQEFLPLLLSDIAKKPNPDQTFQRMQAFVDSIVKRSAYISLLIENPNTLQVLVQLCSHSDWITHLLASHPILLDDLLNIDSLFQQQNACEISQQLHSQLSVVKEFDLEKQMELLRRFKQANDLKISAQYLLGYIDSHYLIQQLTIVAEVIINQAVSIAWQDCKNKYGFPSYHQQPTDIPQFAILAYGKLGSHELNINSDLDLVFIYLGDDQVATTGPRETSTQNFYQRLAQRLTHILTTKTLNGKIYSIDTRLRPAGSSGLLASHFSAFQQYQINSAWTWEHQALVRARCIYGTKEMENLFQQLRCDILATARNHIQLVTDIVQMRNKMHDNHLKNNLIQIIKYHEGGIIDIEFIVQYLVLNHSKDHIQLTYETNNIKLIKWLAKENIIRREISEVLIDSFQIFQMLINRQMIDNGFVVDEKKLQQRFAKVSMIYRQLLQTKENPSL